MARRARINTNERRGDLLLVAALLLADQDLGGFHSIIGPCGVTVYAVYLARRARLTPSAPLRPFRFAQGSTRALRETSEVCPLRPKHARSVPRQCLGMRQNDLALRLMQRLACQ